MEETRKMMNIIIVRAEAGHLPHLAEKLRESDKLELYASMGDDIHSALELSYERSVACWCILVEGEPIMIWGVAPFDSLMGKAGMPWMVGTPRMREWNQFIGRRAGWYIDMMHYLFPLLINYVHGKNRRAMRFLRWCGFAINPSPLMVGLEIFYEARRTLCVE